MKFVSFEHCGAVKVIPKVLIDDVEQSIDGCAILPKLRSSTGIRDAIKAGLLTRGWSGEVTLAAGSDITITSARNNVGLCLQTGNMSRMYADLLKLQKLFLDNAIKAGVMIVPSASASRLLGSNIANSDRLGRELEIFRKVIHMPLLVYSIG